MREYKSGMQGQWSLTDPKRPVASDRNRPVAVIGERIFQPEGVAVPVEDPSVELRKVEKRAGQLQSLTGPVQFFKLALQPPTPPGEAGREALTNAGIGFGALLPHSLKVCGMQPILRVMTLWSSTVTGALRNGS